MTGTEIEPISGELVPDAPRTLFGSNDPAEVLAAARSVADALKDALDSGGMVQRIGQSEHVKIDGWQTLGGLVGVSPYIVWSRPLEGGAGWEARAEARTVTGNIVGAAEAMCTRSERNWRRSEDYAIRSMAQTRAMSKALSAPLRFIVTLAGRSGTPAEEIDEQRGVYGPEASPREQAAMGKALQRIYGDDYDGSELALRLIADADDYLPRIVARALMLTAQHRPADDMRSAVEEGVGGAEAGLGPDQDAPSGGGDNAPDGDDDGSEPAQEEPPDQSES